MVRANGSPGIGSHAGGVTARTGFLSPVKMETGLW